MAQSPTNFANKLLMISLENGRIIDEKVSAVLATLKSSPPRRYKEVLEAYLLKVGSELRKENATIEHSGPLTESTINNIRNDLSKYYNRDIHVKAVNTPELLAGIRISAADDVWDTSVSGRLKQLTESFK
jgi:F0F1-type ATP synthase delta subunit